MSQNSPYNIECTAKKVEGFDEIELLVINDGSSDDTVKLLKIMA